MGVKNLKPFLRSVGVKEEWQSYACFSGKRIAVDAAYVVHKLKAVNPKNWPLMFTQFLKRCVLDNNLDLLFVFDGKAPPEKQREHEARLAKRDNFIKRHTEIYKLCNNAEKLTDHEEKTLEVYREKISQREHIPPHLITTRMIQKFATRRLESQEAVTGHDYTKMRDILTVYGIPYEVAKSEGEMHCVKLVVEGRVDYVLTVDSDAIVVSALHGVQYVLTNFKHNRFCVIDVLSVLSKCNLTPDRFLDFCILCGTDFNNHIKGIGYINAYKLIKTHDSIEHMTGVDISQLGNYHRVREIYKNFG